MKTLRHILIKTIALFSLGIILVLVVPALHAQTAGDTTQPSTILVTDDQVNAIAKKLYCPVCENITLDTCGTAACADWRYEIRLQLEAGKTEQQIVEDFVLRFGDRVVGTPLDPVLRLLSLVTPWLMIAAGLFLGVRFYQDRSRPRPQAVGAAAPSMNSVSDDTYRDLLEQDLK